MTTKMWVEAGIVVLSLVCMVVLKIVEEKEGEQDALGS